MNEPALRAAPWSMVKALRMVRTHPSSRGRLKLSAISPLMKIEAIANVAYEGSPVMSPHVARETPIESGMKLLFSNTWTIVSC